jgi:hypothetical protein
MRHRATAIIGVDAPAKLALIFVSAPLFPRFHRGGGVVTIATVNLGVVRVVRLVSNARSSIHHGRNAARCEVRGCASNLVVASRGRFDRVVRHRRGRLHGSGDSGVAVGRHYGGGTRGRVFSRPRARATTGSGRESTG